MDGRLLYPVEEEVGSVVILRTPEDMEILLFCKGKNICTYVEMHQIKLFYQKEIFPTI